MMKTWKYIILTSLLFMHFGNAFGQYNRASAVPDTSSILIGDQVNLRLSVTVPGEHLVSWPGYKDTLVNRIEILKKSGIDTLPSNMQGYKIYYQDLLITSFDSGEYLVPAIRFYHGAKDDTVTEMVETMPFYFKVHTLEVDTTLAIKAIKPPLGVPYTFKEALLWILILLGILGIAALAYYYIRKRKRAEPLFVIKSKPKLPAYVIALNGLEELRMKKLWQAGKIKEFYTEMTDIVRIYLEDRFHFRSMEMTTDEILANINDGMVSKASRDKLRETLTLADLVKFAKEKPLPLDNDNCLNRSIEFVNETTVDTLENKEEQQGETDNMILKDKN